MIPKRAIFCWSGPPRMSWLREQSMDSFRRLNPEWEVSVVRCDHKWPGGAGFRFDVLRTDYARYIELAEQGGLYFDTDIAFVKPIPEKWLQATICAPLNQVRRIEHIACLGGVKGHPFWSFVAERCRKREANGLPLDCQAFGIKLLQGVTTPAEMSSIPVEAFLTHSWDRVEYLWSAQPYEIPEHVVGVHWYGGDRLSQDMELLFGPGRIPPCVVSTALGLGATLTRA